MSTLHIPDDMLKEAGVSEGEALDELACALFASGKLSLFSAARLAGRAQADFEGLLLERRIPIYHYDRDDLRNDLETLRRAR